MSAKSNIWSTFAGLQIWRDDVEADVAENTSGTPPRWVYNPGRLDFVGRLADKDPNRANLGVHLQSGESRHQMNRRQISVELFRNTCLMVLLAP